MYIRGRILTIPRPNPISIPLISNASKLSKFLQGNIGIADSFYSSILQKQLSPLSDPNLIEQFQQNFDNRPTGVGVDSLERTALKSKFDTLFPVTQLVMILLQMLKVIEDCLCRIFMRDNPARYWWALNYQKLDLGLLASDINAPPSFPEVDKLRSAKDELTNLLAGLANGDTDLNELTQRVDELRQCLLCDVKDLDRRIDELECARKLETDSFSPPNFDPVLSNVAFQEPLEEEKFDRQVVYLGYFDNEGNRVDPPEWIKSSKKWVPGISDSLDVFDPDAPDARRRAAESMLGVTLGDGETIVDGLLRSISSSSVGPLGDFLSAFKDKLVSSEGLSADEVEEVQECCLKEIEERMQAESGLGLDLGGGERDVESIRDTVGILTKDDVETLSLDGDISQSLNSAYPENDNGERTQQVYRTDENGQADPGGRGNAQSFNDDDGNTISSGDNITMLLEAMRDSSQLRKQAGLVILMDRFVRRFIRHRRRERERVQAGLLPGGFVSPLYTLPPLLLVDRELPYISRPALPELLKIIDDPLYRLTDILPPQLVQSIRDVTARTARFSSLPRSVRELTYGRQINSVFNKLKGFFDLDKSALRDLEALHPYDNRNGSVQLLPQVLTRGGFSAATFDDKIADPEADYLFRIVKVSNDPNDPNYQTTSASTASADPDDIKFTNDSTSLGSTNSRMTLWSNGNNFLIGRSTSTARRYAVSSWRVTGRNRYRMTLSTADARRTSGNLLRNMPRRTSHIFIRSRLTGRYIPYKIVRRRVLPQQDGTISVSYDLWGVGNASLRTRSLFTSFNFQDLTPRRLDSGRDYTFFSISNKTNFTYTRSNIYSRSSEPLIPGANGWTSITASSSDKWFIFLNTPNNNTDGFVNRTGLIFSSSFFDDGGQLSLNYRGRQISINDPLTDVFVEAGARRYRLTQQSADILDRNNIDAKEYYGSAIPRYITPGIDQRFVGFQNQPGSEEYNRYKTFWLIEGHYAPSILDADSDDVDSSSPQSISNADRYRSGAGNRNPARYRLKHVPSGIRKFSKSFLKIAINSFLPTVQQMLEIIKDPTKIGEMIGFILQQRLRQDFSLFDPERMYNDTDLSYNYTYFNKGFRKTVDNEVISTVIDGVATVTVPGLFTFGFKIEKGLLVFIFRRDTSACKFDSSIIQLLLSLITMPVKVLIGIIKAFLRLIKGLMSIKDAPATLAWFLSFKWLICLIDPWNLVALFGLKFKIPPFGLPNLLKPYTSVRLDPNYSPISDPILGDCEKSGREGEAQFLQSVETLANSIQTIQNTPDELLGFMDSSTLATVSSVDPNDLEKAICDCLENDPTLLDRLNKQAVETFRRGTGQLDYLALGLTAVRLACACGQTGDSLTDLVDRGLKEFEKSCPPQGEELSVQAIAELLSGQPLNDSNSDDNDQPCMRPEILNAIATANISYGIPLTFDMPAVQLDYDGIGSDFRPSDIKPGQDASVELDNPIGDGGRLSMSDVMGFLRNTKLGVEGFQSQSVDELRQSLDALRQLQPQQFNSVTVETLRNMSFAAVVAKLNPPMIDMNDFIRMPTFYKGLPKYTPEEFKQLIFLPLEFVVGLLQLIEDIINGLIVLVFSIFGLEGLFPVPRLNLVCKIPKFQFEEDSWRIQRVDRCPSSGKSEWTEEELDSISNGTGFSSAGHGLESDFLRSAQVLANNPRLRELCGCTEETIQQILDVNIPKGPVAPDFATGPDFPYTP